MARLGDQNENIDQETELVSTSHRDREDELVRPDEEQDLETLHQDPREAMEELGEDVASSPARRAHGDPQEGALDLHASDEPVEIQLDDSGTSDE